MHTVNVPSSWLEIFQGTYRGCVAQRSRFYSHTQETFDVVFSLTVDAFKVLEQVVDLNSLNFVITYSSTSGVFGDPGIISYAA